MATDTDDTPVAWGVIGCGRIAQQFCADMSWAHNGVVRAVASRTLAKAQHFAERHHIDNAYGSYQQLLDDPSIEVVYIATPHVFHCQQSIQALKRSKAVVCEKPIAVNLYECQQLFQVARCEKVYVMEAMWSYFLPAIKQTKAWIDKGVIGELRCIEASFGFVAPRDLQGRHFNKALGGGSLYDIGIYPLAMAAFLLGEFETSWCVENMVTNHGVDSEVSFTAQTQHVQLSFCCSFNRVLANELVITGSKGRITVPDFWQAKGCQYWLNDGSGDAFIDQTQGLGYQHEAIQVAKDIRKQRTQSNVMTLSRSLWLQQQMEKIRSELIKS
ncbi:Gfo/Idh/MocA family protein [Paraferrimonas haliotis]|uniref:Dehydrogenase n=1 Tax=Paraferrimonas haliotis TaxID=2013866 RepID=A0AA37TUR0_9GAMM|nr:Gfo/Idh/MocA family oxidoreductase [Paraferrimonas haliotis]GLS84586.1 dehydrogenase [Paraferrimonas haliotis]